MAQKDKVERNREYVLAHLRNNPCTDCGEKDIQTLEFDHIKEKRYKITDLVRKAYSLCVLIEEMSRCEVVCANCHRKRTYKRQGNVYKCR